MPVRAITAPVDCKKAIALTVGLSTQSHVPDRAYDTDAIIE